MKTNEKLGIMKKPSLFVFFAIVLLGACVKDTSSCHFILRFANKSDKLIYMSIKTRASLFSNTLERPFWSQKPNTTGRDVESRCYEEYAYGDFYQTIVFQFFDGEIIETVPWDTIQKHNMCLAEKRLTITQLDSLKWKVTYP